MNTAFLIAAPTSGSGRPSINIDTFMATPQHVRELFAHYGKDADVCIVEGMMKIVSL